MTTNIIEVSLQIPTKKNWFELKLKLLFPLVLWIRLLPYLLYFLLFVPIKPVYSKQS